jgi:hypothetical protein
MPLPGLALPGGVCTCVSLRVTEGCLGVQAGSVGLSGAWLYSAVSRDFFLPGGTGRPTSLAEWAKESLANGSASGLSINVDGDSMRELNDMESFRVSDDGTLQVCTHSLIISVASVFQQPAKDSSTSATIRIYPHPYNYRCCSLTEPTPTGNQFVACPLGFDSYPRRPTSSTPSPPVCAKHSLPSARAGMAMARDSY